MFTTRYFNQIYPTLSYIPTDFENSLIKAHSTRRRWKFLKECFAEQVLPKSLLPFRLRYLSDIPFDEFAALILKKHIQVTKTNENMNFKKLSRSKQNFFSQIPDNWKSTLLDQIYSSLRRRLHTLNNKLNRKLRNLINDSPWTKNTNNDVVLNLSSVDIDSTTIIALSYGLNFSIDKKPSAIKIASAFKKLEAQSNITATNIDIAKGIIYKELLTPSLIKGMPRRFIQAINKIKNNPDLHITKADKSNTFVILDKDTYIDKIKILLNDSNTYSKLRKNPLDDSIKHFNKEVKSILKNHKSVIDNISVRCPNLPYMCGLVKTHKNGSSLLAVFLINYLNIYLKCFHLCLVKFPVLILPIMKILLTS